MTDRTFPLTLSLDYDHSTGGLTDYFEALVSGRARGSRCPTCGDVRIPPRAVCPDDGTPTETADLPGTGCVAAATRTQAVLPFTPETAQETAPQVFVLVAMDGAGNFMFGRMRDAGNVAAGSPVRLVGGGTSAHPGSAAVFMEDTDT